MSEYIRRSITPLALGMALVLGACDRGGDDATLAQDSALSRDLALANADSTLQPSLTDTLEATPPAAAPAPEAEAPPRATPRPSTPARRTPARTSPRPSTPAPKPAAEPTTTPSGNTVAKGSGEAERTIGTIPAGTQIVLTSNSKVCTNTHKVGDRFTATVANSVTGSNGAVIPAGATAVVRITGLDRSENANDPIRMSFDVVSIKVDDRTVAVNAKTSDAQIEKVRNSTRGNDAKKVIGGAVLGAIAGQVLGKDTKSTVIGAATGAAAGTAAAAATANYEGCVNDGGRLTIVLNEAASFPVASN
ncbi:MAG TPA: hypothetical protein VFS08_06090 [Gemmatimonadaceae bacterium]|nr:hypothetical protein [Gemmatimonadaceae bacterium]